VNAIGSSLSKEKPELLTIKIEEVVIYNTHELLFSEIHLPKEKRTKENDGLFHFEIL
jgi:hypothetical protein